MAQALRDGDLDAANLSPPERLLIEFAGTIGRAAYRVTDEQVQALREAGWTEEQIAEAAYAAALIQLVRPPSRHFWHRAPGRLRAGRNPRRGHARRSPGLARPLC